MKGARGGFTLVEVMLAGAIAVLMTLALMEGLVVAAKISHENSQLLAADGVREEALLRRGEERVEALGGAFVAGEAEDLAGGE